jgi:hypothetical protein
VRSLPNLCSPRNAWAAAGPRDNGGSGACCIEGRIEVVLIALALLGPDIEEAQFRGRNWAGTVRRITAKANQLSASPDVTDDLKKQIEELKIGVLLPLATLSTTPIPRTSPTRVPWCWVDTSIDGALCKIQGWK